MGEATPGTTRARQLVLVLVTLFLVLAGSATAIGAVTDEPRLIRAAGVAPAERGWQAAYTDATGLPARWDPCAPVPYVVRSAGVTRAARRDLAEALRRVSAVSGLRFEHVGEVDELPSRRRPAFQPERYGQRWAPMLVAFVRAGETDLALGGKVPGTSMVVAVANRGGGSVVSGQVVVERGRPLPPGFGRGLTRGKVLMHEIAHALGLGHVDDPGQLMYPKATDAPARWGSGDRAGLSAIGAPAGCHPPPPPRAIDPELPDDDEGA